MKFIVLEGANKEIRNKLAYSLKDKITNSIISEEEKEQDIFLSMRNRLKQQSQFYTLHKHSFNLENLVLIQNGYYYSDYIYNNELNKNIISFCFNQNVFPRPDLTIILDIDPILVDNGKVLSINKKIRDSYLKLPYDFSFEHHFKIIDATSKSIFDLTNIVNDMVDEVHVLKNDHERLFKNAI